MTGITEVGYVPRMQSDWRSRLTDAIDQKKTNMKRLSLAAGLGETFVRDTLLRQRIPSVDNAMKLCRVLGVSYETIFGSSKPKAATEPDQADFTAVGRFDAGFSMGPGSLIAEHPEPMGYWMVETQWLHGLSNAKPAELAIVRCAGDSMQNTLFDGDWVLVDKTQRRLSREGIYAIRVGDDAWIKRVSLNIKTKKIRVLSDNPTTPAQPDVDEDDLSIIGRVIALVARKVP